MKISHLWLPLLIVCLSSIGCVKTIPAPDLGRLYDRSAMATGPDRNPVIVIPGILGSKLVESSTDTLVWGAFEGGAASPSRPEGARLVALPMQIGKPLRELTDSLEPDGALDRISISILGLPVQLDAYINILGTLGVGGYRDLQLGEAGAIDYGPGHYTCFQFAYDWRRDNVENARKLHRYVLELREYVQQEQAKQYGGQPEDYDVKFDIVAHSMGGLIARYMLRYGEEDLPSDGSTPPVTWAGAEHIDRVVLVGTPNAGSVSAVTQLVDGVKFTPIHPRYQAAVLGTMPSIYQLMPRPRHGRVLTPEVIGQLKPGQPLVKGYRKAPIYDVDYWIQQDWGLVNPKQDRVLQQLLPDVGSKEARREIAIDHLRKSLSRAEQLAAALDQPAYPSSAGIQLHLYAGDAVKTDDIATVDPQRNRLRVTSTALGDGTVTRESALMDERLDGDWQPILRSPIAWTDVNFLFTDHLGLTADREFADNVLHLLLESPRRRD
jgi:pimeloyl-ACP methyl ester carboxylesterase